MSRVFYAAVLSLLALGSACTDGVEYPTEPGSTEPVAAVITAACPLVNLPPSAQIVTCFNATLIPGVWHGWILEQSLAQPTGFPNGAHDRVRLNHLYVLASPAGYTQWGPSDPIAPPGGLNVNVVAFQTEFNGFVWYDVLRLHAAANGGPQNVSVVVYIADPVTVAADIVNVIDGFLAAGVVNDGQANALTRKIQHALDLLSNGKNAQAVAMLEAFIQQVNDLTYIDQVLSPAQATMLIAKAQTMIQSI